jgi:hypothetical protein
VIAGQIAATVRSNALAETVGCIQWPEPELIAVLSVAKLIIYAHVEPNRD